MKFIFTLLLGFLLTTAYSQKWDLTTNYSLGIPRGDMSDNIAPAHSFQLGILRQLPGPLKQLSVGLETGLGIYAYKRIEQTFQFNSNTAAVVPVNYTSNVFNIALQTRFNLVNNKNPVIPYVFLKGGLYNFFSNITVEDPLDDAGCSALERENIINDNTMYWSGGGGLQIDYGIFSKCKEDGKLMFDLGVGFIRGSKVDYINTKKLMSAQDVPAPGVKPVSVKFINASTQDIHEHTVAQVYTSPLKMLEFRFGVKMRL